MRHVYFFQKKNLIVIGIDNNLRKYFFGKEGSNQFKLINLKKKIKYFDFFNYDIRSYKKLERYIFKK